jgi:L-ascorbate metabolism protein UlaG (beta-lactamase superfamily)
MRHQLPAQAFDELPHVDVVLLLHANFDHPDLPTLRRFSANTQAVTARLTRGFTITDVGHEMRIQ